MMGMMYVYTLMQGLHMTEIWVIGSPLSIREVQDSIVDQETIYCEWNFYAFFSHLKCWDSRLRKSEFLFDQVHSQIKIPQYLICSKNRF
jgi:hypothetical protein